MLFIPGYYSDVGPLARQARELGMRATLLGGDGWDSGERLGQLGGAAVEGALYSTHFAADNPGARVKDFLAKYKARFGHLPDALGALGYDAARVGIDALRRSGGTGGPMLREQIARTRDFDGITGRITLGPGPRRGEAGGDREAGEGRADLRRRGFPLAGGGRSEVPLPSGRLTSARPPDTRRSRPP